MKKDFREAMNDWPAAILLPLLALLVGHVLVLINDGAWGALDVGAVVAFGGVLLARSPWLERYELKPRRRCRQRPDGQ